MFGKTVALEANQYDTIRKVAKELKSHKDHVAYSLIELGIMVLVTSRKSNTDGKDGLEHTVNHIKDQLKIDYDLSRMAELLEKYNDNF